MSPDVAALYIDPRGPYPRLAGVDCWDESRDARNYAGPWPVVAHPPCGPWSRLRMVCRKQDPLLAPLAVEQVRRWGGVLEHPESSILWPHCNLPAPGAFPDEFGGWSLELDQVSYGHAARKRTKLYIVGCSPSSVRVLKGGTPTHRVARDRRRTAIGNLKECSAEMRRRTPTAFAEFLVALARSCRRAAAA